MILLCGIPSETPLALVCEALEAHGARYVMFNQRRFAEMHLEFAISSDQIRGVLQMDGRHYSLEHFEAVYIRLMDDQFLPELASEPVGSLLRLHCRNLHQALLDWCEIAPLRVVNRMAPMASNFSKPYQAQLIRRHGFLVPETLITNDPELALAFYRDHGRVIYKSVSGVRSIVQTLGEADLARLGQIRWCPTQFQEYVEGGDVRVHVIGRTAFATAVRTTGTDYRYARRDGGETELTAVELPSELVERCVALTAGLGLAFAGVDLKITPDGRAYCFEVNPCPAFSYYELNTGQPIARAVAAHLAG